MNFLQKIIPTNLLEEKEKFFTDNNYDPQFFYSNFISNKRLHKYGKPKQKYLELAQEILDKTYFDKNEDDLSKLEGKKLSASQIIYKINNYLNDYQLNEHIRIIKSKSFIARTMVNNNRMLLRLPLEFREKELEGMLNHEVATHILRKINDEAQTWHQDRSRLNLSDYSQTEEGIAVFHTLLATNFKLAYKVALYYLLIYYSQNFGFVDVWNKLKKYVQNEDNRWLLCVRGKRGLKDTSKAGGYTKDIMYLEGMIDVWKYLQKNNFDIGRLYFGKIALKDVKMVANLNPNFKPKLPIFFSTDRQNYAFSIQQIAKENGFYEF